MEKGKIEFDDPSFKPKRAFTITAPVNFLGKGEQPPLGVGEDGCPHHGDISYAEGKNCPVCKGSRLIKKPMPHNNTNSLLGPIVTLADAHRTIDELKASQALAYAKGYEAGLKAAIEQNVAFRQLAEDMQKTFRVCEAHLKIAREECERLEAIQRETS